MGFKSRIHFIVILLLEKLCVCAAQDFFKTFLPTVKDFVKYSDFTGIVLEEWQTKWITAQPVCSKTQLKNLLGL